MLQRGKVLNVWDGVPVRYGHFVEDAVVTERSPVTNGLETMCSGVTIDWMKGGRIRARGCARILAARSTL